MSSQGASIHGYSFIFYVIRGLNPDGTNNTGSTSYFTGFNLATTGGGRFFKAGDSLSLPGTLFGGTSPANDFTFTVTSVNVNGSITTGVTSGLAIAPGSRIQYGPFYFNSPNSIGYVHTELDVRDSSEWTSLKRKSLIARTAVKGTTNQLIPPDGQSNSAGYRMDVKDGRLRGQILGCDPCYGAGFNNN
jgi:hypothetical protein